MSETDASLYILDSDLVALSTTWKGEPKPVFQGSLGTQTGERKDVEQVPNKATTLMHCKLVEWNTYDGESMRETLNKILRRWL